MNKPLATLGIFALTGVLAVCDLCGPAAATGAQPATSTASPASLQTVTLAVKGMTCAGCVLGTRTVLKRLPGVTAADVSYDKGTAVVTYDPSKVTVAQMVAAIKTLGYSATKVAS